MCWKYQSTPDLSFARGCCWKQRFLLRISSLEERRARKRELAQSFMLECSCLETERERVKRQELLRYKGEVSKLQTLRVALFAFAYMVVCLLFEPSVLCHARAALGHLAHTPYRALDSAVSLLMVDEYLLVRLLLAWPLRAACWLPSLFTYASLVLLLYVAIGVVVFRQGDPLYVLAADRTRRVHLDNLLRLDSEYDPRVGRLSAEISRLQQAIDSLHQLRKIPSWFKA